MGAVRHLDIHIWGCQPNNNRGHQRWIRARPPTLVVFQSMSRVAPFLPRILPRSQISRRWLQLGHLATILVQYDIYIYIYIYTHTIAYYYKPFYNITIIIQYILVYTIRIHYVYTIMFHYILVYIYNIEYHYLYHYKSIVYTSLNPLYIYIHI